MNVPSEAYGSIESSKLQPIAHNGATHPGLYVTSARKFELNNDFSCPNIKEKWPTSANSVYVLRNYELSSQVSKKFAYIWLLKMTHQ